MRFLKVGHDLMAGRWICKNCREAHNRIAGFRRLSNPHHERRCIPKVTPVRLTRVKNWETTRAFAASNGIINLLDYRTLYIVQARLTTSNLARW